MNVSRHTNAAGVACSACHRLTNGNGPHSPPGVPGWRLPPAETPMVFEGRSPRALCEQLKRPAMTNGKDLAALTEHIAHDPLVLWGWQPGAGRTLPPVSHATFELAFRSWVAAGAPCPAGGAEP